MNRKLSLVNDNQIDLNPIQLRYIDINSNQHKKISEQPYHTLVYSESPMTEIQTDYETFVIEGPFYIHIPMFMTFTIKNIHNLSHNYLIINYNINNTNFNTKIGRFIRCHNPLSVKINYFFKEILTEISTPSRNFNAIVRKLFNLIILFEKNETVNDFLDPSQINLSQKIQTALFYIHNHFHQAITIQDMANVVGYSQSHFCNIFKKETNYTPIQYLTKYRMEHAHQLLENSKLSIQEVAIQCGYQSASHFSTRFKNFFGYTPKNLPSK
ncbi:helix-turn-helix transcriptional regulator [Aerococcaceae bacterium WGS1372]